MGRIVEFFPIVMYGCKSWTIKKAERRRIGAFELGAGENSWESLWLQGDQISQSKWNQSWIFIGMNEWMNVLKLKVQYFGHLIQRTDSLKKTLMLARLKAGGEGDDRGWDGWMASLNSMTWVWASSWNWWWTGKPGVLQSMESQRVGHDSEWTELWWALC